jgi:hypothetical protein
MIATRPLSGPTWSPYSLPEAVLAEQPAPDVDRVVGARVAGGRRPQELRAWRDIVVGVEDRAHPMRALGRNSHVGEPRVDRLAHVVEVLEVRAHARERAVAALTACPCQLEPDVQPDN